MTKLRFSYTKSSRKVERAPRFPIAHLSIFFIVATFGVASVVGAVFTVEGFGLDDQVKPWATLLGAVLAFSVAIVPVLMAPAWATARGWMKFGGFLLVAGIMLFDAAFQVNAVNTFERKASAGKVEAARTSLETVQAKIDALPTSQEVCVGHGPQNCASRREGLKDDRAALVADRSLAEEALTKAEASSLPLGLIAFMMTAFQVVTFFARAWLSSVTAQRAAMIEEAVVENRATKAERKVRELQKQVRELSPRKRAKPRKPDLTVVANDG